MENLFMAATNLYGILPISIYANHGLYMNAFMTFLPMFASILYHLAEHSKHSMSGFAFKEYEHMFLNFDRVAAVSSMTYFSYNNMDFLFKKENVYAATIVMLSGFISENIRFTNIYPKMHKNVYLICHSLGWHIGLFHLSYLLARHIVGKIKN